MNRGSPPRRVLAGIAALARIEEMGGNMTTQRVSGAEASADRELKASARAMWALGDYHDFAKKTVWELGPVLVDACGVSAGQRVLDVAAGTGNVAIRAAEAGAQVVASDLTGENFQAGEREAHERGVELEWVVADAEALPFGDGEFDVVTSVFGAMFAPNHRAVAHELLRVCRPGGTIGLMSFTPEGLGARFFELFGRYAPAPPPDTPPVWWGSEDHVREWFGDGLEALELTRKEYVETSPGGPNDYCELFKTTFGPVIAVYASLADQPGRVADLDREFLEFATSSNRGAPGSPAEYHYEYLLVVGRKRDG